jgi:5'-phosphate synthase pdxT subunit
MGRNAPSVGVLALQGDFAEHRFALTRIGANTIEVRNADELAKVDALIIPGGESTAMAKLIDYFNLRTPLRDFAHQGMPIWGTCAGLILMASELAEERPEPLNLMNITVIRNGFGRQAESFETEVIVKGIHGPPFHGVFIRAPKIDEVGPEVEVLATLGDGSIVAARERNFLATAFHPELTPDMRIHQYFMGNFVNNG